MAQEASSSSKDGSASSKSSPSTATRTKKHSQVSATCRAVEAESSGSQEAAANQHQQQQQVNTTALEEAASATVNSSSSSSSSNNKTTQESPARKASARDANMSAAKTNQPAAGPTANQEAATKEKVASKKGKKQKSTKKKSKRANKADEHHDNDTKTINHMAAISDPNGERSTAAVTCPVPVEQPKQKSLVDELKLFQNNHLLNQQDPIQQLHIQLNQLTRANDEECNNKQRDVLNATRQSRPQKHPDADFHHLEVSSMLQQQPVVGGRLQLDDSSGQLYGNLPAVQYAGNEENIFTIKKGVLWQQQHYDKFHQRLFSRWKKRYFILTTDYLVCFKRSTSKVGRSEMGKFLYKTALSDVTKIERSKPKKSDKGAIVLHIRGQFNLFLWSKENLDEWMFMLSESIERNRIRRSCQIVCQSQQQSKIIANHLGAIQPAAAPVAAGQKHPNLQSEIHANGFYENSAAISATNSAPVTQPVNPEPATVGGEQTNCVNKSDDITSSSSTGPETRSQTITKRSKNSVHPIGSREQQPPTQRRTPPGGSAEDDSRCNSKDETNGDNKRLESSGSSSAGSRLSNRAKKNSIERDSGRGGASKERRAKEPEAEPVDGGDENESRADNGQASGRGAGGMVIYDPTDNDGSCTRTNGSDKHSGNQAEQATDSDGRAGPKSQSPGHRAAQDKRSSPRRPQLKNQILKEKESSLSSSSSSSSSSARSGAIRRSKQSPAGSPKVANENEGCEPVAKERKRSSQKHRTSGKTDSSSSVQASPKLTHGEKGEDSEHRAIKCNNRPIDSDLSQVSRAPDTGKSFNAPESITNRPLPAPANLIRRDDSWQSLVSLTRVGKVTPAAMQAQRSLYAQHIMPESSTDLARIRQQQLTAASQRQHMINIESTITPSRGPFLRQHSVQSSLHPGNRFRPLPPIGGVSAEGAQHAASFDLAASSSLLANQRAGPNQPTSYQQKLLQLQLLHNSNNVDYIRHNNGDSNDYQIYGPESTNGYGYGYGYSSMRSNLKSAASEFSFIRPSSVSQQAQSTLPHPPAANHQQQSAAFALDNQSTRHPHHPMRSSFALTAAASPVSGANGTHLSKHQSDSNNNDIGSCLSPMGKHFLANAGPIDERIINQQQQQQPLPGEPLVAPMRELPLKPNKKRAPIDGDSGANNLPKSSSLTSSIACFFRRAFSRRSKKRRSKLAESCSSSLGAFEDGYASGPIVPSAFSTGSKSVDGAKNNSSKQVVQSPRMIDMIEAFANKTHANETTDTLGSRRNETGARQLPGTPKGLGGDFQPAVRSSETPKLMATNNHIRNSLNQFGSPLHKSNSISATMGLSFANDQSRNGASFLYDNAMMAASGGSPMLMRSNKVLSANLTSLALQQQHNQQHQDFPLDHQSFLSPRNSNRRSEQLPRPSSIYGQPSMISPIVSREDRNSANFGLHRNSMHNHQQFRDRSQLPGGGSGFDIRRHHHQLMKGTFLDTTREVAEDLPSPVADASASLHDYDSRDLVNPLLASRGANSTVVASGGGDDHYQPQRLLDKSPSIHGGRYLISASPSSGKLHQRQAIVNPILQSPTMGTIYDNHPMLNGAGFRHQELSASSSSYSHYDNHNQLLLGRQQQQTALGPTQLPASPSFQTRISGLVESAQVVAANNFEDPYGRQLVLAHAAGQSQTPSHHRPPSTASDLNGANAFDPRPLGRAKKPSAIVAPSTTSNSAIQQQQQQFRSDLSCDILTEGSPQQQAPSEYRQPHNRGPSGLGPQTRSPIMPRRAASQNHYQQSPLVSSQTRVLNKGDGVQATVPAYQRWGANEDSNGWLNIQPVVNIAGAPGINLEPSLAASLLKGTNIDAYECSTFDRLSNGRSQQQNSKTFLVSTRLSKSLAYSQSGSPNENGSTASIIKDESSVSNSTTCMRSSRDELSSSGSRSINSSIGERSGSSRLRSLNLGTSSSHEGDPEQDESSSSDTRADKSVITANRSVQNTRKTVNNSNNNDNNNNNNHHRAFSGRRNKRESSSETSEGDVASQLSLDKPDERNWITSKLVE